MHPARILSSLSSSAIRAARLTVFALSLAALCATTAANALTRSGTVRVTPELALPGQERTITFSGVWQDGCVPVAAGVTEEPPGNPVIIRLRVSVTQSSAACTQAITPYELTYKYTPKGSLAIVASITPQIIVGYGSLAIGDAPIATTNLSGSWIDWTQTDSILNLTQSTSSSAVVGNWGTFNNAGVPTWYFIHSSRRVAPNILEASLSEYIAEENSSFLCPPVPRTICPGYTIGGERKAGLVQITFYSKDVISLLARVPGSDGSFANGTTFLSNSFSRYNF
jgi:hypothetical protein